MTAFWDERYNQPDYVYGTAPNEFLVEAVAAVPPGRALGLGEGEGRNAVYLAAHGFDVLAVDSSAVGLLKAQRLAAERGVSIDTVTADLADFALEPERWDLIYSIFCHLPPAIRRPLYARVVAGLKPDGRFVLEAYTPAQLSYDTGGPKDVTMLLSLEDLQAELSGLEFVRAQELMREVREGAHHTGLAAVVQLVARKPAP